MNTFETHVQMIDNAATVAMRDVKLSRQEAKSWLRSFRDAGMVNLAEVGSLEDMRAAQKFCSCMRVGLLAGTSAEDLWDAWREVIGDDSENAHEAECRAAAMAICR